MIQASLHQQPRKHIQISPVQSVCMKSTFLCSALLSCPRLWFHWTLLNEWRGELSGIWDHTSRRTSMGMCVRVQVLNRGELLSVLSLLSLLAVKVVLKKWRQLSLLVVMAICIHAMYIEVYTHTHIQRRTHAHTGTHSRRLCFISESSACFHF